MYKAPDARAADAVARVQEDDVAAYAREKIIVPKSAQPALSPEDVRV